MDKRGIQIKVIQRKWRFLDGTHVKKGVKERTA